MNLDIRICLEFSALSLGFDLGIASSTSLVSLWTSLAMTKGGMLHTTIVLKVILTSVVHGGISNMGCYILSYLTNLYRVIIMVRIK